MFHYYRYLIPTLAGILLWLSAFQSGAETLTGRVVGVHDGDTVTLLQPGNQQAKIRLNQIDAPELKQDFGQASKKSLADLVFGKEVQIDAEDTDKYGRTVGTIRIAGLDVNLEQVRRGMAWAYRKYLRDPAYLAAEETAKHSRLGLWSRPDAVPPWDFRHPERRQADPMQSLPPTAPRSNMGAMQAATPGCGSKRFCREMRDCAEARFYLQQCGVTKLDGNGDGVPCESLCK